MLIFQAQVQNGKCVIYGKCHSEGGKQYLCSVDHPPKTLSESGMASLQAFCPELTSKYGNNLCCDEAQVTDLTVNLALPQGLLSRCPSCFYNFRQSLCDFTCSPYQYRFLNANATGVVEDPETGLNKTYVIGLNYFIGTEHVEKVYESCKDVVQSASNAPAMDYLCGPWGSYLCTPKRWFDYMGDSGNNFAPFDILYQYIEDVDEGVPIAEGSDIVGYNNMTYSCSAAPPVS
jgi:hypothetical protein